MLMAAAAEVGGGDGWTGAEAATGTG